MNTCISSNRDLSHSTSKVPMMWISWTWTQIWALADTLIHLILGYWWLNYQWQGCALKHSYLSTRSLYNFYDWYSSGIICLSCISLVDEICGCPPYLMNYSFFFFTFIFLQCFCLFFFSTVKIWFRPLCEKGNIVIFFVIFLLLFFSVILYVFLQFIELQNRRI